VGKARVSTSWSPEGKWILLDADGQLFVVRPDGTRLHQIRLRTEPGYFALEPSWSPDGTRIVFAMFLPSLTDNDIFPARPNGTDVVNVTRSPEQHEGQPDWGSRRHKRT
jgi:Tol biopolymer transport system component